jgi:hypothetical protein
MHATTVKLDGDLVSRLKAVKPRNETLTGFVRNVLDAEVRRQHLLAAAEAYAELLRAQPGEAEAMDAWTSAPLERPAKARRAQPRRVK